MIPHNFPFSAVIGQQQFKLALILSAINPAIGGVLVSGPRGSAKSTLARGMVDILADDANFVTLPLAASEEMLVGTLDLQQVLQDKKLSFSPGLLAKADQGVLYVDEVNLLADPLVDLLLDTCASGINYVERDGISHQHSSRFILLGTMNPDEGELRAQLLDRFGLSVNLSNQLTIDERIEIVQQREAFDNSPTDFIRSYHTEQLQLRTSIVQAKQVLNTISCSVELRKLIAIRCHDAQVDGLRADIVWLKAASAHAAWFGRAQVSEIDIVAVEELVLAHRRNAEKNSTTVTPPSSNEKSEPPPFTRPPAKENSANEQLNSQLEPQADTQNESAGEWGSMAPVQQEIADIAPMVLPKLLTKVAKTNVTSSPSLQPSKGKGSVIGGIRAAQKKSNKIAWFDSLVSSLGQWPPEKLRFKKAKTGQLTIHCILLDTSASTLKKLQFSRAKAIVMQLAEVVYRQREQLVVFGFGNQEVSQLMSKQKAPKNVRKWLEDISAAGGTPLRDMLKKVVDYQNRLSINSECLYFKNYLITDGRSSQQVSDSKLCGDTILIDIENAVVKRGRGREIANQLDGQYFLLPA